jgi:hypothetical protein
MRQVGHFIDGARAPPVDPTENLSRPIRRPSHRADELPHLKLAQAEQISSER